MGKKKTSKKKEEITEPIIKPIQPIKEDKDFSLTDLFTEEKTNESSEKFKLISELMNTDKNIEIKTEISNPINWSVFTTYREFIQQFKLPVFSSVLLNFEKNAFKYLISKKRQSRKEIVDILKNMQFDIPISESDKNVNDII